MTWISNEKNGAVDGPLPSVAPRGPQGTGTRDNAPETGLFQKWLEVLRRRDAAKAAPPLNHATNGRPRRFRH